MSIRRCEHGGAAAGADIWLRARHAASAVGAIPPCTHSDEEVREWFTERVARGVELWLADIGAEPVAMLLLEDGWVDQLYVVPEVAGHGVGSCLLAHAKARYPRGLRLWTFQSNDRAQRFYERHGFVAIEKTDGARNEERAPDVLYAWGPS